MRKTVDGVRQVPFGDAAVKVSVPLAAEASRMSDGCFAFVPLVGLGRSDVHAVGRLCRVHGRGQGRREVVMGVGGRVGVVREVGAMLGALALVGLVQVVLMVFARVWWDRMRRRSSGSVRGVRHRLRH